MRWLAAYPPWRVVRPVDRRASAADVLRHMRRHLHRSQFVDEVHRVVGLVGAERVPSKNGVWKKLFEILASDADNEYAMIDSTIVRAHQHSAGAQKKRAKTKRSDAAKAA